MNITNTSKSTTKNSNSKNSVESSKTNYINYQIKENNREVINNCINIISDKFHTFSWLVYWLERSDDFAIVPIESVPELDVRGCPKQ